MFAGAYPPCSMLGKDKKQYKREPFQLKVIPYAEYLETFFFKIFFVFVVAIGAQYIYFHLLTFTISAAKCFTVLTMATDLSVWFGAS